MGQIVHIQYIRFLLYKHLPSCTEVPHQYGFVVYQLFHLIFLPLSTSNSFLLFMTPPSAIGELSNCFKKSQPCLPLDETRVMWEIEMKTVSQAFSSITNKATCHLIDFNLIFSTAIQLWSLWSHGSFLTLKTTPCSTTLVYSSSESKKTRFNRLPTFRKNLVNLNYTVLYTSSRRFFARGFKIENNINW